MSLEKCPSEVMSHRYCAFFKSFMIKVVMLFQELIHFSWIKLYILAE